MSAESLRKGRRHILNGLFGAGMSVFSLLTIRHYFAANFSNSILEGFVCDINDFFNCDSSAYSVISQVGGVPLGYFGLAVGVSVLLGGLFHSEALERTNRFLSGFNVAGVIGLFLFSVLHLGTFCLLCGGYYVCSVASFLVFWKSSASPDSNSRGLRLWIPSSRHLATFAVAVLTGAYAFSVFHQAKMEAQSGGVAARLVKEYFELPEVRNPSLISPFWIARSTEDFEAAPIHLIEYADFLCPDCRYLAKQLSQLKKEFEGKINIAFQFFPLDARCNPVVEKDMHPGACDLSYMAAFRPAKFNQIHDEVFANLGSAWDPDWRSGLARRYGVEEALSDRATRELVHRIIHTGAEYKKTSDQHAHGIRSTPTMILNNRMIIGTLRYEQMRAIFRALVEDAERAGPGNRKLES